MTSAKIIIPIKIAAYSAYVAQLELDDDDPPNKPPNPMPDSNPPVSPENSPVIELKPLSTLFKKPVLYNL